VLPLPVRQRFGKFNIIQRATSHILTDLTFKRCASRASVDLRQVQLSRCHGQPNNGAMGRDNTIPDQIAGMKQLAQK
jgi:hypothetical protein